MFFGSVRAVVVGRALLFFLVVRANSFPLQEGLLRALLLSSASMSVSPGMTFKLDDGRMSNNRLRDLSKCPPKACLWTK